MAQIEDVIGELVIPGTPGEALDEDGLCVLGNILVSEKKEIVPKFIVCRECVQESDELIWSEDE